MKISTYTCVPLWTKISTFILLYLYEQRYLCIQICAFTKHPCWWWNENTARFFPVVSSQCFFSTAVLLIAKNKSRPRNLFPFFLVCKSKHSRSNGGRFACLHCVHTSTVPCQLTARPWNKNRAWKMHLLWFDFGGDLSFKEYTCSCVAILELNS